MTRTNYEKWKEQLDIVENLMEVLYGVIPNDLEKAQEVNQKIKETLLAQNLRREEAVRYYQHCTFEK